MEAINQNVTKNTVNTRKIIVARDVAKEAGCSLGTVYVALGKNNKAASNFKPETLERVRRIAKEIGYDPVLALNARQAWKNRGWTVSTSGNFATRQEETDRMLYLRNERAMTNEEIAGKVGVSYNTVLNRIGSQPKELTEMSFTLRGERTARRNQARRDVLLKQKITQFEKHQQEIEAINAHAAELEAQAQRIADEAKAIREQYSSKVVELDAYRKEAEKAAMELGRSLA